MCGRVLLESEIEELDERYNIKTPCEISTNLGEIFPSNFMPVIANEGENILKLFKWGFYLGAGKQVINARSETIGSKMFFKESFYKRRCIVPVNAFFEWKEIDGKKVKHKITMQTERIFSLGGIYNDFVDKGGNPVIGLAIVTTSANEQMSVLHHRMPLIINREEESLWLKSNSKLPEILNMLNPYKENQLVFTKI